MGPRTDKPKTLTIYIASSWRNQHAVEMLTEILCTRGHKVASFVEEAVSAEGRDGLRWDLIAWIESPDGQRKFEFDITAARTSDLVVYIGPSGTDAWAEVGVAWVSGVPVIGLWAKAEKAGLMRRMVRWYSDHKALVAAVDGYAEGWRAEWL